MTAYSEWTLAQQKTFWQELADVALARWGMAAAAISWLGYSSNAVFKARSDAGDFVLRLQPAWRANRAQAQSELTWLRAIRRDSDLQAPFPIVAAGEDGDALLVEVTHPQLPPPHVALACLFEFIPGQSKAASALSKEDMYMIGRYLAQLHSQAQVEPLADIDRPRLADAQGLFGDESPYAAQHDARLLTKAQRDICRAVERAVGNVMSQLQKHPAAFGLVHADLLAKNILFTEAGIAALDFEYCAWGCFLYDLAPLLWQLKGERAQDYTQLEASLWAGYTASLTSACPPRDTLETFIAARQLASCRWLLNNRDHPQIRALTPALLKGRIEELRDFLECGKLQRRTATL
ncbi:MAG: phosphotransferase [Chloroflexi bacterium]|nr:phosphotransferase [Chloroflexota bacterium]MCY3583562.1 phosphotransferase [Chloroflexota bacterium]MCY3715794.1 phosphotransferase [Chloroflexota bacterium]MDE2651025.1 phosphotransferase [Chloroflexota bacterium]MXV92458.1 phosphotransferase [Chloroflexota bacterium]